MKYSIWCYLFGHRFIMPMTNPRTRGQYNAMSDFCQRCGLSKKEVKLPEMLTIDANKGANQALENDRHLAEKINQILAYLASKENK